MRKIEILAVGKACKAIFWRTPGLQEGTFDSSGLLEEEALLSKEKISCGWILMGKWKRTWLRADERSQDYALEVE